MLVGRAGSGDPEQGGQDEREVHAHWPAHRQENRSNIQGRQLPGF